MMENPESLIKLIEKYQPKNKSPTEFNKRGFTRMKSQILSKSLIPGFRINTDVNKNKREFPNCFNRSSQKNVFNNSIDETKNDKINMRKSMDKSNIYFKNKNKMNKKIKNNKNIDSYESSYKLSVSTPDGDTVID